MRRAVSFIAVGVCAGVYFFGAEVLHGADHRVQAGTAREYPAECVRKVRAHGQPVDVEVKECFPEANNFKWVQEPFSHVRVYDKEKAFIGVCFYAEDVIDDVEGFKGPVSIFMGLTPQGEIQGIFIVAHCDTLEYARQAFSERFLSQFRGKRVSDGFSIGKDIQAVSGATISSSAVIRIVKNAAAAAYRCLFFDGKKKS